MGSPTRSRLATPRSASCAAGARRAASAAEVEDGQGDGRQEDGGPPLPQVQRDGSVQLPAAAAARVRHLQELRGPVARGVHGRQWCCDAWQGHLLRAQGGGWRRRQEEVSWERGPAVDATNVSSFLLA